MISGKLGRANGVMLWVATAAILAAVVTAGCVSRNGDEHVSNGNGISVDIGGDDLVGTNEYLYAVYGKVYCLDWEGTILWESPHLGSRGMVFAGDAFLVKTYDKSERTGGVALLSLKGEVLWKEEIGLASNVGLGASREMLAAGTRKGVLWTFSRTGDVLWTFDNHQRIEQVVVAPDSSCVIFTDFDHRIHCVREGELVWSQYVGSIYTGGGNRTVAAAPDSSYLVYRYAQETSKIVAATLDGKELWSYPLEDVLQSVVITDDSQYIIAGCHEHVYKLTADGTLVWKWQIGEDNMYIAVTPDAGYIVVGSISAPSHMIVLNGEGEVLWKKRSLDNIYDVAISPDGKHVAFSNRFRRVYLFSNLPQSISHL